MQVHYKRLDIENAVADFKKNSKSIGFVPTMGALHEGHASLIKIALNRCEKVIVSIFVNPTQFNNPEDLKTYPRDIEGDLAYLKNINSNLVVFIPDAQEVYGASIQATDYDFEGLENEMEGRYRPGHFQGVGTVLKHLFTIVNPDKAFFGEKDFQQLQIIKKMVEIEALDIDIIPCPISRAEDGLALSSRNKRLTKKQRSLAPKIYEILAKAKEDFNDKTIEEINRWVTEQFHSIDGLELEYFEIADPETLKTQNSKNPNYAYRGFIAVYAGDIRLIDNIALT